MSFQVPDACTLPTAAQPLREEEFATLCRTALRTQERLSERQLRLTLSGPDHLLETVTDLAARESDCCSFFDFTVTSIADVVVLDVAVPAAQIGVLDGLSELASSTTSARR